MHPSLHEPEDSQENLNDWKTLVQQKKASQAEARDGLLAVVKPIRAIPAPKKFYEETKVACMQTDNENKI